MYLANDEIKKLTEQIQAEEDSSKLLALVERLTRLLEEQRASMKGTVPLIEQAQESQSAD